MTHTPVLTGDCLLKRHINNGNCDVCHNASRFLIFLLCSIFSFALYASEQANPDSEFERALSIIEQTQLEIFTTEKPTPVKVIKQRLVEQLSTIDDETSRLEIMRNTISDAIDQYNDQYANYLSPQSLIRYQEKRRGSYHGIGLKFRAMPTDYPVVIGALIGGPLEHSSLTPGDKILSADGTQLKGLTSGEIVKILKGPEDTTVTLRLESDGEQYSVTAKRGPVNLEYARAEIIESDIGYLKISRFGGKTHETVRRLVSDLLDNGVTAIVLDLRDNPGGSTRAARSIASIFLTEDDIYCERYKSGTHNKLPRHGPQLTDLPLAVLVNGNSMSSSEIVAGALQAYSRATLVGEPTYGKGLVQKVFDLAPPLGGAIRTTIAEFMTPDGQPIHGTGIVPDKFVRTDSDFMFRRTGSLNIDEAARAYQRLLLEERVRADHPERAARYIAADDVQLQTAISLVRTTEFTRAENQQ